MVKVWFLIDAVLLILVSQSKADEKKFPDDFSFGVSNAAYQVEGGWDADGKGPNIWDHLLHTNPDFTYQQQNGDVAADTYHHCEKDVTYLSEIGVTHYRFSIAWSRILPNGKKDNINQPGIDYYNRLINALVAANIKPMVTLYHWDLPQALQDEGGWLNRDMIGYFEDYARICFKNFGDRVKLWLTFNEPISTCRDGYEDGTKAPALQYKGTGAYSCAHVVLLSHGRAYRLYESEFKPSQNGRVSATIDTSWYEPANQVDSDKEAANRNLVFNYEWWMNPIVEGDYPELMKTVVAANSAEEGLSESRLPEFTDEEKAMMKGSFDFVALNYYTSWLCWAGGDWGTPTSSWYRDVKVDCSQPDDWWPGSGWLRFAPWGLTNLLHYIRDRYGNPEVIITENGYSDEGNLKDDKRVEYMRGHLANILDVLDDGCNVSGYTYWGFLDDFEWTAGYLAKFGMVQVNFDDDSRPRTRKYSTYIYNNIITTRKVDYDYAPEWPPAGLSNNTEN